MPISMDYFKVPKEFIIGGISDIREDEGQFGPQIVLEITPLGETTPRLKWYNAQTATNRRSGWQRFLKGLREIGLDTTSRETIINQIVKIEMVESSFTTAEGEDRTFDVWKPVKLYTSESDALEDLAAMEIPDVPGPSSEPAPATPTGIDPKSLEDAQRVWKAVEHDEDVFRSVAVSSWPDVDVDELLKALSS